MLKTLYGVIHIDAGVRARLEEKERRQGEYTGISELGRERVGAKDENSASDHHDEWKWEAPKIYSAKEANAPPPPPSLPLNLEKVENVADLDLETRVNRRDCRRKTTAPVRYKALMHVRIPYLSSTKCQKLQTLGSPL